MNAVSKLGVITLLCLVTVTTASAQYYYGLGEKRPLFVDSSMMRVKFEAGLDLDSRNIIYAGLPEIRAEIETDPNIDGFVTVSLERTADYDATLNTLARLESVEIVEPYYLGPDGEPRVMGLRFSVGFHRNLDRSRIDDINARFKVEFDRELYGMPNVVVLRNTQQSAYSLLDIANAYYELDETYFAQPCFSGLGRPGAYELKDQYHSHCAHVKQVIGQFNVNTVWDFASLTDSLVVAVIDDGVTSHPDLPAERILPGYECLYGGADATPGPLVAHGMACAGLIAAEHSIVGAEKGAPLEDAVISLNPHVRVMPIRIFRKDGSSQDITRAMMAEGISYAWRNGADILSNSWSSGDFSDPIYWATRNAVDSGRGGLGCPVIFCAGNDSLPVLPFTASMFHTFAVSAPYFYSNHSLSVDVTAPSGDYCYRGNVWTLDQKDDDGMNTQVVLYPGCPDSISWNCESTWDNNINCHFGGTSASAAIVSGVASLLLARDPDMPVACDSVFYPFGCDSLDYSVYNVLRRSAVPISSPIPNIYTGYGRVDAYRAILSIARGDANNTGEITVGDISYLVDYLYERTVPPPWPDSLLGDISCNGAISIADISILIDHLFISGDPLPLPCFEFND